MENLQGKGALQGKKLRYNKARRGEVTPQHETTKKTGSKVKATFHDGTIICGVLFPSMLAYDICSDLYKNVSLVASIVGNLIREFIWRMNSVCPWTAETHL